MAEKATPVDTEIQESEQYWGTLFAPDKTCTEKLTGLLTAIAKYISINFDPNGHNDLTPTQLAAFYRAVGGNYDVLFVDTPPSAIAFIYQSLGCLHSFQPSPSNDGFAPPTIPALKARGFITWQTIQLLLGPDEHVPFLQRAVQKFEIIDPETGNAFPKVLPASCFPETPDEEMVKWYEAVSEKLRHETEPTQDTGQRDRDPDHEDHTVGESGDEWSQAAQYFSNPLYRDRAGRPAIERRFSRPIARSPREFLQDRGRAVVSTVRHLWNPMNQPHSSPRIRRRSWEADDDDDGDDGAEDEDITPVGGPLPARYPSHTPSRSRARSISSISSSSTEAATITRPARSPMRHRSPKNPGHLSAQHSAHHSRTSSPNLRHRRSHDPPPSPREYFPPQAEHGRRHSSAHASPAQESSPLDVEAGFAPSTAAPFAAHVSKLQPSSSSGRLYVPTPTYGRRTSTERGPASATYRRDSAAEPPRDVGARYVLREKPVERHEFERRARRSRSSETPLARSDNDRERDRERWRRQPHRYVDPVTIPGVDGRRHAAEWR